jgi:glycosyltransferase involved in cell wall biosynthesis
MSREMKSMKVLTVVSAGLGRPDKVDLLKKEESDLYPRASLYERVMNSDMLDEAFMDRAPGWRKFFYKRMPMNIAQVFEAYAHRKEYDAIITWAERLGLPFALLLKLTMTRTPHLTLNSWISGTKKALVLKYVHSHISRIFMWSSVQRDYAINELGIPESKIAFVRKFADQQFWRPSDGPTDMICAVGSEMRDYPTFVEAMKDLTDIPCHIAAGRPRGIMYDTVKALDRYSHLPPHITVGARKYHELRDLYARSRFVVVPLRQTDTDNGLTCILESMAMGKAVICSRTQGQVDVVQENETGIFVPQGDPRALRDAIRHLWDHPEEAARMGKAGRAYLERHHTIEQFVESVRKVTEEVIREHNTRGSR